MNKWHSIITIGNVLGSMYIAYHFNAKLSQQTIWHFIYFDTMIKCNESFGSVCVSSLWLHLPSMLTKRVLLLRNCG